MEDVETWLVLHQIATHCWRTYAKACLLISLPSFFREKQYKFYLSFENAICDDYVSEKLFHVLDYDTIPITYGGANYSKIVPHWSTIDALSFSGPKDLASYLKYLNDNPNKVTESNFHQVVNVCTPDSVCRVLLVEGLLLSPSWLVRDGSELLSTMQSSSWSGSLQTIHLRSSTLVGRPRPMSSSGSHSRWSN